MEYRASVVGGCVGALVGAVSRAAVASYYVADPGRDGAVLILIAAAMGMIIGALGGATAMPVLGAAIGAALSMLFFALLFPLVAFFDFLGALTTPSIVVVLGLGALAGAAGGAVGRRWA